MPIHRSSVARIQQVATLTAWLLAAGWLAWNWESSPWSAAGGFLLIGLSFSLVLALEFMALRWVDRGDPAALPGAIELVRAWAVETVMALRVFCWRQPFRSREIPDLLDSSAGLTGRRGVVFVHGFICNRGFWTPWLKLLTASNHAFAAVDLEPVFCSLDDYPPIIDAAVAAVTEATGLPPLLVCHSMGGLAVRAWLKGGDRSGRVHHVVTIGTPHGGTWLGRFSRLPNGSQMGLGSQWLCALDADCIPTASTRFTCWYSNCDNVVFPTSTATLPGADNRLVCGVPHVALAFHPQVIAGTLGLL